MAGSILRVAALLVAALLANAVQITETSSQLTFWNRHVSFDIQKSNGYIQNIIYQNTSLLGNVSALTGQLYTDWPSNGFALVSNSSHEIFNGSDWAGIVFTDNNAATGGLVQRSWFLRDEESGLHSFLRLAFFNETNPVQGALGESRTMFRPNTDLWTHVATHPSNRALADEIQVQDATWYIANTPNEAYVKEASTPVSLTACLASVADLVTKYTFADNQTNKAHGLYGVDAKNTAFGAWWVVNQKDTFFGGPNHFDLMVDGIAYNKQSTSHGGASSPNITNGFDRTFGPQFVYFNNEKGASIQQLLADAEKLADPAWNTDFYDEIAPHVAGYVPTSQRGQLKARISVPHGAGKVSAVLSANKLDFQDSAFDTKAYQYWVEDVKDGSFTIDRVKAGTYRLTVYADGIFGDWTQDDIVVHAKKTTSLNNLRWHAESAGRELWRIGIPDKTSGEFRNGFERDLTRTNQPHKYRIYWGAWDYPTQFPNGVNFTIGKSDYAKDWNYVHWSVFGPSYTRNNTVDVNRWQINFDLDERPSPHSVATYTIQLAGATTTSGNTDSQKGIFYNFNVRVASQQMGEDLIGLQISTYVNDETTPLDFPIYYYQSGSCAVRSGGCFYDLLGFAY
ncbi:hypothetical protein EWM64_g4079 [Hericium alpestre]|uniref:rhamnogalacturonan endolyase n=1 Tax=Hericium alpestre TaxID=135208 RepID=A0A4Z0A0R7_9AGAM|nr:hypothetical protein EWM64_g4079 [Hericium alpestre]